MPSNLAVVVYLEVMGLALSKEYHMLCEIGCQYQRLQDGVA